MKNNSIAKRVGALVLCAALTAGSLAVAAGAAQLGLSMGLCTKLPDHALTRFVLEKARSMGVDTRPVIYDRTPQARLGTYYYEGASAPRKPSVVYDRAHSSIHSLRPEELPEEELPEEVFPVLPMFSRSPRI